MNRIAAPLFALLLIAGCSSSHPEAPPADIPKGAIEARAGIGRLFFEAMDPGTVYVYDASEARTILVQEIQKGQRFTLKPDLDLASLEGKTIPEPMEPRHIHRIFFLPGGATTAPSTRP